MSLGKTPSPEAIDLKPRAALTVLARDTALTGEIEGSRPVRLEGVLKGSLQIKAAVDVAEGAVVHGDIHATVIRVAGQVSGDLHASELVELLATSAVKGNVHTPALHVIEGATLDGQVQMHDGAAMKDQAARAPRVK